MKPAPQQPPHPDSRAAEFVRLLSEHDARLYAYILSLVPNWTDAEEIAQDVRLRLWEQFDAFDVQGDFGAWACSIAYYKVLAHRKTAARQAARLSTAFVEAVAQEARPSHENGQERYQAMMTCLQKLKLAQRDLLMHYYASNQSMREIAAETDQPFHGVRQSILRMRKALARCIRKRMKHEERR